MPELIDTSTTPEGSGFFKRKQWTVAECKRLVVDGLLDGAQYELIEGDIVSKMGQGRLHVIVVTRLLAVFGAIFGIDFVQTQASIGIGEVQEVSDPEPDIAILREDVRNYAESGPDPSQDVLLVVEAFATSLRGDLSTKARIYAQAGVPEYWVVDIAGRRLHVFRDPDCEATTYRQALKLSELEQVSPLSAPQSVIRVADLLP